MRLIYVNYRLIINVNVVIYNVCSKVKGGEMS